MQATLLWKGALWIWSITKSGLGTNTIFDYKNDATVTGRMLSSHPGRGRSRRTSSWGSTVNEYDETELGHFAADRIGFPIPDADRAAWQDYWYGATGVTGSQSLALSNSNSFALTHSHSLIPLSAVSPLCLVAAADVNTVVQCCSCERHPFGFRRIHHVREQAGSRHVQR